MLSPPDGGPAVGMLIALLASALFVSLGNAMAHSRDVGQGVHWHRLQTVPGGPGTHIVTSGIGGTMVTSGAGLQYGTISRIPDPRF